MDLGATDQFWCGYCDVGHDRSLYSDEHIIPEKLGNHGLVLPGVCRAWNNWMAVAFENRAMNSDAIRFWAARFDLSDRPFEQIVNDGASKRRWTGTAWETENFPSVTEGDTHPFLLHVHGSDEAFVFHLRMPERLPAVIRGHPEFVRKVAARSREADGARLRRWLETGEIQRLNPEFAEFLEGHDMSLDIPSFVSQLLEGTQEPRVAFLDDRPLHGDAGSVTLLLAKIGWTYACAKLGPAALRNPIGQRILDALRDGIDGDNEGIAAAIDSAIVKEFRRDGLHRHHWCVPRPAALTSIEALGTGRGRDALRRAHDVRWARMEWLGAQMNIHGDADRSGDVTARQEHRLDLGAFDGPDGPRTCVRIALFGGMIRATVPIAPGRVHTRHHRDVVRWGEVS